METRPTSTKRWRCWLAVDAATPETLASSPAVWAVPDMRAARIVERVPSARAEPMALILLRSICSEYVRHNSALGETSPDTF